MSGDLRNQKNKLMDQKVTSAPSGQTVPNATIANKKAISKPEYHDDYDQIQNAVLETKRGRWFLGEYTRRNRVVESQLVLDALAKIETKISANAKTSIPEKPIAQTPAAETPKDDFETAQQSSHFGQLFANFKHKTTLALQWVGIKDPIDFSKIQTIINFAAFQSRATIQSQEKKLNQIIQELQTQNINSKTINKLQQIATELNKLEELQANLNVQLEDGLKFMGEVEKIAQKLAPDLSLFVPKNIEKVAKNTQKVPKNEQKTPKNVQKTSIIEPKTAQIEAKKVKLGPAGRIKKMFKIEQTLHQQIAENITEPAKAFDEAFATERLQVEQDLQSDVLVLEQTDIITDKSEKEIVPQTNKIAAQTEKLATIGNMMKQVDAIKSNAPKDIKAEPKIIIDESFNALNSLALLSKTERTMLFTLQN